MSGILPVSAESLRARLRASSAVIVSCAVLAAAMLLVLVPLGAAAGPQSAALTTGEPADWFPRHDQGDYTLATSAVWVVAGIGAAASGVLGLLALLGALRAQRHIEAALAWSDQLQGTDPDRLSAIHVADLVEHVSVVADRLPRARRMATGAFALLLVGTFFLADALFVGTTWIALAGAACLALAGALLLVVAPVVLAAVTVGQGVRALVRRATGQPLVASRREAAGRRWSGLVINGTYRVDLASRDMQLAFRRTAPQWLAEVTQIAGRIRDALQAQLREKPDNPLKGVPSGAISKWGEKLGGLDKVLFDPGRVGPHHVAADDVRLKVDRDYVHWSLTITSSTGGKFPGECTLDSAGALQLPDWASVTPMVETLAVAGMARSGKSKSKSKSKDKSDD